MEENRDNYDEQIAHGEAIARLLNDTTVQKVFSDMQATYYANWIATKEPEDREVIWMKVWALGDLKSVFESTVQSGLHAKAMKAKAEREASQI